ncbi:MAG: AAA family ATPase [Rikenellaceae bacterium]
MSAATPEIYEDLSQLASHLRATQKKYTILFAHNGTGKTRLSMEFSRLGKENGGQDTLYFNAFTEDLFSWDNDLDKGEIRVLKFNKDSNFFDGLDGVGMEDKIRVFLHTLTDFDFKIDYNKNKIVFNRMVDGRLQMEDGGYILTEDGNHLSVTTKEENIKISRGEENIFIWCFFLAIAQMAIDGDESYKWVKYIYIDDPISSLDDNNVVAVGAGLAKLLKAGDDKMNIKTVISTHHGMFYNVLYNELKKASKSFLNKLPSNRGYSLIQTDDTPFFHHVVLVQMLKRAIDTDKLYTYHFSILRNILEKTAAFHGFSKFSDCINKCDDEVIHSRRINILSHGNYSIFEPTEMQEENKEHFKAVLSGFLETYKFNKDLFEKLEQNQIKV